MTKKVPENAKKVFEGEIFDVYQWEQELFDGSTATFEKVMREGSTQIIAIDKNNNIILTKEQQPGSKAFISIPGGKIERGQTPEDNAKNELLEETGMKAESFELWTTTNFGGKLDCPTYYYIAKGCEKVSKQKLDAGEKIELYKVNFEELFEETEKDEFRNKGFSNKLFRIKHTPEELEKFRKLLFD